MIKIRIQKILAVSILILAGTSVLFARDFLTPNLGVIASDQAIDQWDISIMPDGEGLPPGSGTAVEGRLIYQEKCINCHGPQGAGGSGDKLAGARMGLTSDYPEKIIGNYWPYATTIFDMIRRSMPMTAPGTLTDPEVYSLTAYLLFLNGIIEEDDIINQATLSQIKMPNRDGFINIYKTKAKTGKD